MLIFIEYLLFFKGLQLTGDLIGYIAAVCTTIAYVPQAVKVYKTRRTNDISIGMFTLMTIGVLLWLIYGLIVGAYPLIAANFITFLLSLYIFIMKIKLDYLQSGKAS